MDRAIPRPRADWLALRFATPRLPAVEMQARVGFKCDPPVVVVGGPHIEPVTQRIRRGLPLRRWVGLYSVT